MTNQKGLSILGLLLTVLIIAILLSIMLPKYQKTVQTQQKQAVEQARQAVRQLEKVSTQRAKGLERNGF